MKRRITWTEEPAPTESSKGGRDTKTMAGKSQQTVTQTQGPHYGLHNQGATCYLNSVLQVLSMTTEIHDRLDPKAGITDQELKNLFEKLKETTCKTENITKSLAIENVNNRLDAAKCLEMILQKVFQGQLTHTKKCSKGHNINVKTNPFWTLPLSLKDTNDTNYNVERSFERNFESKSFTGRNLVYCNECEKKTEAKSGCEMEVFPQILTLLLKRFDFDRNTMTHFKSNRCVDVPRELQIKDKKYKLYGMVNHMGGLRGGHYTATILSNEDKTWYEFNDTRVSKVKEQPFAETNHYCSTTAYLLMYRAISEGQTDTIKWKDPRQVNVEHKGNIGDSGADNEGKTQTGQNDVLMGRNEALRHQTGGEEGDAESVESGLNTEVTYQTEHAVGSLQDGNGKVDMEKKSLCGSFTSHNEHKVSVSGKKHDTILKVRGNHGRMSEVKSSGDERENPYVKVKSTHFGITQAKSKEMTGDDSSRNRKEMDSWRVQLPEEKKMYKNNQKGTRKHRLHYGLRNQGATCYLNSVLQVLSMTTEIHDRLDPKTQQTDRLLRNIFEGLKKETCGTETITAAFGIQNVYEQQDAAECLDMILRQINPQASEVFQGKLKHTTKCSEGHNINVETNPFWTLPLSLMDTNDTNYNVERSFERVFESKSFTGRNLVYCKECEKKTEAKSGCEMEVFPQILTLLLKRFDFDYNTMTHFKSNRCVDVPRELQIKDKKYKLYGMVNHMGGLRGGHYTATILSNEDKTWYEFDDNHVSKVKEQPFAETNHYCSTTAYLLMYRAISEGQTDTIKWKDPRQVNVEHKGNIGDSGADNEGKTQTGQNDVLMGRNEALRHQTGGEEGDAESVENVKLFANTNKKTEDNASRNHKDMDSCVVQLPEEMKMDKNNQKDAAPASQKTGLWSYIISLIWLFFYAAQIVNNSYCKILLPFAKKSRVTGVAAEQPHEKAKGTIHRRHRLHYGLRNQGATCYLNSVLQVLSMTTEIHDRLDPKTQQTDRLLRNIFEGLKKETCGTETITAAFGIQNVYEQQDAAECLDMILRQINPQASEVFQGKLKHTTKCFEGHNINLETNPFWTLPLSLMDTNDTNYNVERSFKRVFKSKSFTGRNLVYCNECEKKTEAKSGCEMEVFPQILTLLLKRFDFDYNTMTHFKSNRCVDVPRELQRENKKYELYGMVNHMGSLRGGHYTATILSNKDKTWYEFNDTRVSKVQKQPFAKNNHYNSGTVYLLMYRDSSPAAPKWEFGIDKIKRAFSFFTSKKPSVTDDAADQPDEKAPECQRPDEKREREKRDADNEEETQFRQTEKHEESMIIDLQIREEGDAEKITNDKTGNDISVTPSENWRTPFGVNCRGREEAPENLPRNGDGAHSRLTQENPDELMQTDGDISPLNVGEQPTDSRGPDVDGETEKLKQTAPECQKWEETNSEDLTGEAEMMTF
ncbi:uncharacterized protein LOC129093895 isoform X2 [Anoplopoma fimbria]|uniref:uncharacterized protein LOC129093895 isoform X2 n=1 Tax=Anoplopoma fimbria TaxID=229290 RepID=UPI0023ECC684|nr:uncharacterized protein LOC129093895 isoform X2 [Anoplopoma fimbria]